MKPLALIVGAGSGVSASLARALYKRDHEIILVARDTSDLADLAKETDAHLVNCDAKDAQGVENLFRQIDALPGELEVAIYNPSARVRGPIHDLEPDAVLNALQVTAYGAFLMAHHASGRMLENGRGTLLFTGASAGVKGFAQSAPFAMGKFALRGLCQSLARELHPQNIHVGHIVIDGGIDGTPQRGRVNEVEGKDNTLNPDALAESYMYLMDQHRSAWTWELEIRPWIEKF